MIKTVHDSETLVIGQQVITACAFIHEKIDGVDKLFLPKRAITKKFLPGVFELPGGHIDFGEDLVTGLKREVVEEFGMEISVGDPFAAFTYSNEIKGSHSVEIIFLCRFITPQSCIKLNPEDHSEYIWLAENDMEQTFTNAKNSTDPEIQAIAKGFELLKG